MATLEIRTSTGSAVTVIYPAEKPAPQTAFVQFRVGKKTFAPAYPEASLPHMVQFQKGQRIVMFTLGDVLEASYWRRIRNAYTIFGHLDIAEDIRVGAEETERVAEWLREQSSALGVGLKPPEDQMLYTYS
jgi:hypothetical protein